MKARKAVGGMKDQKRVMKGLYLACSIFGIGYFALSCVAFFVGGAMGELFFSTEVGSVGDILYMASILFWWVSVQLYLRSLPEPKLPDWAKKLCGANMLTYLGVLLLRLAKILLSR